jgi:hypothetical protein
MSEHESALLLEEASSGVKEVSVAPPEKLSWSFQLALSIIVLPLLFTFKPSEWFLVPYLNSTTAFGLSYSDIDKKVFPLWTYSFLGFTLLFTVLSLLQKASKWCFVAGLLCGAIGSACLAILPFFFGFVLWLVLASEVFVGVYRFGAEDCWSRFN